ncbi:hypothetical protein [Actinotalea sp.]|uniref:hypothetical protein n=1 Tax=Actinotalea sp. TaxID=1872145 RepID=UPI002BE20F7B|nr:hypothetical protein [Actinotalea sp.]HQY33661.1 hypothetical protein [Actinotalea sp.]HRA50712.1 hypothetical protein [Actinotalea sp.]
MSRRLRAALVGAVTALALAACAAPLPTPQPDAVPVTLPPAVSTAQVDRILADLAETLAAADATAPADAAASAAALAPRVTGPAATLRAAQYVRLAAGDTTALTLVPPSEQTLVVPTTDVWPRTVMVVTAAPEDLRAPLLLTLVQDGPREPYRLWSWVRLFPGVQMPATTQPGIGSAPVAPDAGTLALAPADVMAQYVDLLTNGDASAYAPVFAADPLRAGIAAQRDGWVAAVADKGSLTETYQALDAPVSLATADGGAIVVGTVQTVTTITLTDSTLTIGDLTAALLGASTVASNLTLTWLSVVAFDVPPAGSAEPVAVLGAEHAPVQVTGS